MRKLFKALLWLAVPTLALAQTYSIFQPGGDLTGTWNSQTIANGAVDLTSAKVTGILPSANGGTASAFFTVAGPATSAKTFTFPNASSNILTDNAAVTVAQGGTNSTTAAAARTALGLAIGTNVQAWSTNLDSLAGLTPTDDTIAIANGTVWQSKAVGDCQDSGGNHLNYTASTNTISCGTTGGGTTINPANPTTNVDLSVHNGSAATFMRSDAAPALSQAIVPTWTGIHTFSLSEPRLILSESDQGTDLKGWDLDLNAGVLCFRTRTDADGAGQNAVCVTRGTTTALTNETFGYSVAGTYTFPFTGVATFSGQVTAPRVNVTGSSAPGAGIYAPAGNTLGIATNSALVMSWDINGYAKFTGAIASAGTKFTASGCSNSTTVGGAVAGKFTAGTTGTCTVTITLPTATNGYTCAAYDITTPAIFQQTASTTTSCTIAATTVTNDIVTFSAMAW